MKVRVKSAPGKIIAGQFVVTIVAALLWMVFGGFEQGFGALVGGGISTLLSLYFAIKVFSQSPEAGPHAMLAAVFKAEALKIVLAAALFSAAAIFLSHVFLPLMTTLMATLAVYWLALLFTRYDTDGFGR